MIELMERYKDGIPEYVHQGVAFLLIAGGVYILVIALGLLLLIAVGVGLFLRMKNLP